jgi:hypothetical protein
MGVEEMTNKDIMVNIRVTKAEKLKLENLALKSHMTISEYLRALVSVAPLIEKEYRLVKE